MDEEKQLLIVENLSFQGEWSKNIEFPSPVEVDSLFAIFQGNIRCGLTTKNEHIDIKLESGAVKDVIILKSCTELEVHLKSQELAHIRLLSITITSPNQPYCTLHEMGIPINTKDIQVIHKPATGYQIAFDFTKALEIIGTTEKSKYVEIRDAVQVIRIRRSFDNFQWRGNILFCRLSVGKYRLRIKIKGGEWSDWLFFKCERPYSR